MAIVALLMLFVATSGGAVCLGIYVDPIAGVVGWCVGLFSIVYFWQRRFSPAARQWRSFGSTPVTDIGDAKDGELVKIAGTLRYDIRRRARAQRAKLEAPISGTSCAHFTTYVDRYHRNHRGGGDWSPLDENQVTVSFLVEDDTGRAWVDAVDATVFIECEPKEVPIDGRLRLKLEHYLKSRQVKVPFDLTATERLRYRQGCIVEGDRVNVLGVCRWEPDPEGGAGSFRQAPRRLAVSAPPSTTLIISLSG